MTNDQARTREAQVPAKEARSTNDETHSCAKLGDVRHSTFVILTHSGFASTRIAPMTGRYRRRRTFSLGLPLLARELSEQAAKGRHYLLRTLFATILFLLGYSYLSELLAPGRIFGSFASLGQGRLLFDRIVGLESLGLLIFLPGMTAGAIAGEKERNTL